jgi:hypothetical protein
MLAKRLFISAVAVLFISPVAFAQKKEQER